MAEVAPAPAAAKAARKKVSRPKGITLAQLVVKVVSASDERSGVSATALKKALAAGGYDVENHNTHVNNAIKNLVTKGTLVQIKGLGAWGSFRMSKTAVEKPAKKTAPTVKKPAAKKPAAAKNTKTAAVKKPAAAAKKSPKKAKKPAAAKKTKTAAAKKHVCVMQPMGDGLSFSCMADCR
ncbi:histone H1-like [Anarhichas minor]|uniref:histone H1-like n=1 Tax=Anarhichas minor TaxID=65739 RepID=UPI003F738917